MAATMIHEGSPETSVRAANAQKAQAIGRRRGTTDGTTTAASRQAPAPIRSRPTRAATDRPSSPWASVPATEVGPPATKRIRSSGPREAAASVPDVTRAVTASQAMPNAAAPASRRRRRRRELADDRHSSQPTAGAATTTLGSVSTATARQSPAATIVRVRGRRALASTRAANVQGTASPAPCTGRWRATASGDAAKTKVAPAAAQRASPERRASTQTSRALTR
jgi:hypothetical protein